MSDRRTPWSAAGSSAWRSGAAADDRAPGRVGVWCWEKEADLAVHQSGHNSGVVHAGIYYSAGSLKATLCRRGASLLREFCAEHGVTYREIGKVVVARDNVEAERLREIESRARINAVPGVRWLDAAALHELEPNVAGVAALHSPTTAIVDSRAVAQAFASDITARRRTDRSRRRGHVDHSRRTGCRGGRRRRKVRVRAADDLRRPAGRPCGPARRDDPGPRSCRSAASTTG